MTVSRTLVVDPKDAGARLDVWLTRTAPELSRARVQALIADGQVRVDGEPSRASARLRGGEAVGLTIPAPVPAVPAPEDIPLRVVYEDDRLLVIDKPAGLVVHPGAGQAQGTLVNALLHRVKDLSGVGGVLRPGIVHRLDRGTSGLIVVAKDDEAHRALVRQFAGRTVEKEYLAIVHGRARPEDGNHRAAHRPGSGPSAEDVGARAARPGGAIGLRRGGGTRRRRPRPRSHPHRPHPPDPGPPRRPSAIRWPETRPTAGRARLPHGVPRPRRRSRASQRPALHAARLVFTHPATGDRLAFESALPDDIAQALAVLREPRPTSL